MRQQMIVFLAALALTSTAAYSATLEIPTPHTTLSGIGVISGWKCEAGELTVRFNGGESLPLVYGSERKDVLNAGACDHDRVGFVSIMNWGELGDGPHTAVVYDDGEEFDRSTFNVVTTGEAFLWSASGQCVVEDFPAPGEQGRFIWNQATQHLELAEVQNTSVTPPPPPPAAIHGQCGSSRNSCRAGSFDDVADTSSHYRWQCLGSNGGRDSAICQVAKPPPPPSAAQFNGTWRVVNRYTSAGCTHYPDEADLCTAANGSLRCAGGSRGTVSASGVISGNLYFQGNQVGRFQGRVQGTRGSGTWSNVYGCGGTWTATKQ